MRDGVKDHNHIGTMPNPTQGVWEGGIKDKAPVGKVFFKMF
jgi:hypothetical protein